MRYPIFTVVTIVFLFLVTTPGFARWPTTDWLILEEVTDYGAVTHKFGGFEYYTEESRTGGDAPEVARRRFAKRHQAILERASVWYDRLGFPAPKVLTPGGTPDDVTGPLAPFDLDVEQGDAYVGFLRHDTSSVGSRASVAGKVLLTTNPSFLSLDEPWWQLMQFSAVHELFHSIQYSYSAYSGYLESAPPGPSACDAEATADDWLTEGTAAYAQIRWAERINGITYGHPFRGSSRKAWLRYFDQPLDQGSLPSGGGRTKNGHRTDDGHGGVNSWYCSYGTWYFWYAVGDMLAGGAPERRITYLQHVFGQQGPWMGTAVERVDAGLRQAAEAFNAIKPYRDGLYDLYPRFVARYLDDPKFYQHVEEVELQTPSYYETASPSQQSAAGRGPLEPLAARAWRVRVHVPDDTVGPRLYTVRFSLEAQQGANRDDLHLIVDRHLAGHPAQADTTYTWETQIAPEVLDDGVVEYLVRIANAAKDVSHMDPAAYKLKIEVEGYYGNEGMRAAEQVAGALPPGFDVQGPDAFWRCSGDAGARAQFSLITSDSMARSVEKMPSELGRSMENTLDDVAVKMQQMQKQGLLPDDFSMEQFKTVREKAEQAMAAHQPQLQQQASVAADGLRAGGGNETVLRMTLVGNHNGRECQMVLNAQWQGSAGGVRVVRESEDGDDGFMIGVYPAKILHVMRNPSMTALKSLGSTMEPPWKLCASARDTCPELACNAGVLTLEKTSKQQVSGSFRFDIVERPGDSGQSCPAPGSRRTVAGHFNVTSTVEDSGTPLDALLSGRHGFSVPGSPFLMGRE